MHVINQAEGGATFWSWKTFDDGGDFYGWSLRNVLRDSALRAIITPRVEEVASATGVNSPTGAVSIRSNSDDATRATGVGRNIKSCILQIATTFRFQFHT
ncbi:Glucan 1,3-beta-glucosidase, partial [Globisporangium polare]